jgi:hypothetical protein
MYEYRKVSGLWRNRLGNLSRATSKKPPQKLLRGGRIGHVKRVHSDKHKEDIEWVEMPSGDKMTGLM